MTNSGYGELTQEWPKWDWLHCYKLTLEPAVVNAYPSNQNSFLNKVWWNVRRIVYYLSSCYPIPYSFSFVGKRLKTHRMKRCHYLNAGIFVCMSCRHSELCINQRVHVRVGAHSRVLYSYNRLSLINCQLIPFKDCNSNFFVILIFLNIYPTIGTCAQRVYLPLELLGVKLSLFSL